MWPTRAQVTLERLAQMVISLPIDTQSMLASLIGCGPIFGISELGRNMVKRMAMPRPISARIANAARISSLPILASTVLSSGFLMGGGSRADILSLFLLRPLGIILMVIAFWHYGAATRRSVTVLFWLVVATISLAALHVIPLPPGIWVGLPLRDMVADSYRDLVAPLPWMPYSLSPARAWNALFFLALPSSMVFASASLSTMHHRRLAALLIGVVVCSGLLGLLQVAGPANGPLYLYRFTNGDASVGLFANRNHNGLLLGMGLPLLALFWHPRTPRTAAQVKLHRAMLVATGVLVLPMVLLTGSRGALLTAAIGVAGAVWIAWFTRPMTTQNDSAKDLRRGNARKLPQLILAGVVGAAVFALALVMVARSTGLERLIQTDPAQEMRLQALPVIWNAIGELFPWGGGSGSFETVYKIFEPTELVAPQYLNHAHNDWLEVVFDFGLPGLLLLTAGVVAFGISIIRLLLNPARNSSASALGWAGATIIIMVATLSLFDYPARVPSIAVVAALAAVWLAQGVVTRDTALV